MHVRMSFWSFRADRVHLLYVEVLGERSPSRVRCFHQSLCLDQELQESMEALNVLGHRKNVLPGVGASM